MKHLSYLILTLIIITSCGDDEDRQEVVKKLRGLGLDLEKPIISLSESKKLDKIKFTVYALNNNSDKITAKNYNDTLNITPFKSDIEIIKDSQKSEKIGSLTLFSLEAYILLPEILKKQLNPDLLRNLNGVLKIRYGISLKSGSEVEKVVGDLLIVEDSSISLKWQKAKVEIKNPKEKNIDLSSKEIDIQAEITNKNKEDYKIHWFTSGGKIKNFRSTNTKWELPEEGSHSLIIGIYGTKSRMFSFNKKEFILKK